MFLFSSWVGLTLAFAANDVPFWKKKDNVYEKIVSPSERLIAVSAKTEKEKDQKTLILIAGGHMKADATFATKIIEDFNSYPKFLPYVESATLSSDGKSLFIHGAVMGQHIRMLMKLERRHEGPKKIIDFESIAEGLVGLKGEITIEDVKPHTTEVGLSAQYKGKTFGIPDFLLNWGLEYAMRKACGEMRRYVESSWKNSPKPNTNAMLNK